MPQKKILLVTRNLPPLVGGMERLNWHMAEELSRLADVRVIGPGGSGGLAPAGVAVTEVPARPLWKFFLTAQWQALQSARHWRPDFIVAGSGLTALPVLLAARACGAKAIAYVHGLDVTVRHIAYRLLWLPALRRMERVIANSVATATSTKECGVPAQRIGIVHPGVQVPAGRSETSDGDIFRTRHKLGSGPLLVSVGRLSSRKGLREFVVMALPLILAKCPETVLLIVGDTPNDALRAEAQTPESIYRAAQGAGVAHAVRFLGTITDYEELGSIYRNSTVHVFPVRDIPGDPEGFGMVSVEAAVHGLPTVAFSTGGVVDAVSEGQSGRLVPAGDYAAFAAAVIETLSCAGGWEQSCIEFGLQFSWSTFGSRIAEQLRKVDTFEE